MEQRRIRVLIAKTGLDGHDRGAKIVARILRDSGMDVIYTGIRQSADQVVNAVVEEDVDVLGLSFLSGDHMVLVPKVIKGLKEMRVENVLMLVGGIFDCFGLLTKWYFFAAIVFAALFFILEYM